MSELKDYTKCPGCKKAVKKDSMKEISFNIGREIKSTRACQKCRQIIHNIMEDIGIKFEIK